MTYITQPSQGHYFSPPISRYLGSGRNLPEPSDPHLGAWSPRPTRESDIKKPYFLVTDRHILYPALNNSDKVHTPALRFKSVGPLLAAEALFTPPWTRHHVDTKRHLQIGTHCHRTQTITLRRWSPREHPPGRLPRKLLPQRLRHAGLHRVTIGWLPSLALRGVPAAPRQVRYERRRRHMYRLPGPGYRVLPRREPSSKKTQAPRGIQ